MTQSLMEARTEPKFSPADLRSIFGTFPTGVVAVAGIVDGERVGVAASSFTSVSLDPPLVSVAFDKGSSTWPALQRAERVGISVLAENQSELCRQLARKNVDRFENTETSTTENGAVFIHGAVSWLEVELHTELDGGDHSIALLTVHSMKSFDDSTPLVFHGSKFRALEK